jgi:putative endonuclease
MIYTVCILYSVNHKKHYTGFTSNLEQRILSHNELGKGWTSKYRPWQLLYYKEFDTKAEAMSHEKWLKTGVGREFIKNCKLISDSYPPRRTAVQVCFLIH